MVKRTAQGTLVPDIAKGGNSGKEGFARIKYYPDYNLFEEIRKR